MFRFVIFVSFALLCSCSSTRSPLNRFSDPLLQTIADHQDRRLTDSLLPYLSHPNTVYRLAAAKAFLSVQDSAAIPALSRLLLSDSAREVRTAAAMALGQIPSPFSALPLRQSIERETLPESYESLGKVVSSFSELAPLIPSNHQKIQSEQAWMLYRYGLRFPLDSIPGLNPDSFRENSDSSFRIAFTQFLSRGVKNANNVRLWLTETVLTDSNADVRMNAAFALRRIKHPDVHTALIRAASDDRDYRVRVNAIRSLQAFPPMDSWYLLMNLANGGDATLGLVASEVIFNVAKSDNGRDIKTLLRKSRNWRVRANLCAAYMKAEPSDSLVAAIKTMIDTSGFAYEKSALLLSLQFANDETAFLFDKIQNDTTPVVRSSAATSVVQYLRRQRNPEMFATVVPRIVSAFSIGDPAVIGTFSEAIADTTLGLYTAIKDHAFLLNARSILTLPRDIEAIAPLENAIALLAGKTPPVVGNSFNHAIDWSLVKQIPSQQHVVIQTTKGRLELELFVNETPGTVSNFVRLVKQGYFNGKPFHRVVPNFVVQTGCNRGDGWGSEDYSIRSEFSERKFTTGSVGMASAGKDTEGTQWFITHSPTPHLDGRYTNFAKVISGMEVVHRLEVGDIILSVKLL